MIAFDKEHLSLARRAAAEGMILLKNENGVLPLCKDTPVALFGRNQCETFKGGGGSADVWAVPVYPFADGMEEAGSVYAPLLKKYRAYAEANRDNARNKHFNRYTFSLAEAPLTEDEVKAARAACETAVVFIGRYSGEAQDVRDTAGRYRIHGKELDMIRAVKAQFEKTVLVLNLPGLFDLSFLDEYPFDAIVHTYLPGMEAGHALADVLYGKVNPSGKLPDTWAKTASDYPTNEGFATERVVYSEGIYMGYRYFDAFGKDVVYPFGFGLSYTSFDYGSAEVTLDKQVVTVKLPVTNTGSVAGREVVQCYLSVPEGKLDQPDRILCGFEKTACLQPGESETVVITVDLFDFTSYCERCAAYILEGGDYVLSVGRHSRDLTDACVIRIPETLKVKQVENRLVPKKELPQLRRMPKEKVARVGLRVLMWDDPTFVTEVAPAFRPAEELKRGKACTFRDLLDGKCTVEELAAQISDEELARIVTGDGPKKRRAAGLPDYEVANGEGSHSHPVKELMIPVSTMQDGPVGVRASGFPDPIPPEEEINGRDCIGYPCSTLVAATWDKAIAHEIGRAIVADLERCGYNGWCAPAVNLHRNPLCGRNFEYFSEDPFLSAEMAIAEIAGIQENDDGTPTGRYAILKHFAFNESEEKRKDSDSVMTERTARELYLRVFELVIRKKVPYSMMSAYNLINGEFTSASHDLLDGICRTEWGYDGWIMTDWNPHATVAAAVMGGADVYMPGDYLTYEELVAQGVDRATMQRRAVNLLRILMRTSYHEV